jgi:uncharacterized protein YggE
LEAGAETGIVLLLSRLQEEIHTMRMTIHRSILLATLFLGAGAWAQTAPSATTAGALITVPASGEVRHANDEATVSFTVEEQDKDRSAAVNRVNQKMKQGTELLRRADPQGELKTTGYSTYPVYPELPPNPRPLAGQAVRPVPIGWRVSQTLELRTKSLVDLPKTAAVAQKVLNLVGVHYHVSRELARQLDDERIAATWRNLNERIASIARAMGRGANDAVIESVDFGPSAGVVYDAVTADDVGMVMAKRMESAIAEPSFEPGETTLQMRAVGKVRFR